MGLIFVEFYNNLIIYRVNHERKRGQRAIDSNIREYCSLTLFIQTAVTDNAESLSKIASQLKSSIEGIESIALNSQQETND